MEIEEEKLNLLITQQLTIWMSSSDYSTIFKVRII